jgi:hypothetical protein
MIMVFDKRSPERSMTLQLPTETKVARAEEAVENLTAERKRARLSA